MKKKPIRSDALFLFLTALVLALMAALTASVETAHETGAGSYGRPQMRKIDKSLIDNKIKSGDLSNEDAKHYKRLEE